MKLIKKITGNIIKGMGHTISFISNLLIGILEIIVSLTISIRTSIIGLLGMGGCLLIFLFFGPLGIIFLLTPKIFLPALLLIIVPILGTKFISYLKYIQYTMTEYLFDRADHLIDGKESEFGSFNEYANKYKRMEEEKRNRERQARQEQQQREWEERFRQWNKYQQGGYYQRGSGGYEQAYGNPTIDFKNKYEKSCDILGIGYDIDKYTAKLAYRKKAKKYHPDINHSPDATQMFQKVNDAYEFLSDENIERYKRMN